MAADDPSGGGSATHCSGCGRHLLLTAADATSAAAADTTHCLDTDWACACAYSCACLRLCLDGDASRQSFGGRRREAARGCGNSMGSCERQQYAPAMAAASPTLILRGLGCRCAAPATAAATAASSAAAAAAAAAAASARASVRARARARARVPTSAATSALWTFGCTSIFSYFSAATSVQELRAGPTGLGCRSSSSSSSSSSSASSLDLHCSFFAAATLV